MDLKPGSCVEGVLVYVVSRRTNQVLLVRKKAKIGVGRWNGYGGGINDGETEREAAVRELFEESDGWFMADPRELRIAAIIDFHNEYVGGECIVRVHTFILERDNVDPELISENAEVSAPKFFPIDALPMDELMASDREWLPRILAGEHLYGKVFYTNDQHELRKPSEYTTFTISRER